MLVRAGGGAGRPASLVVVLGGLHCEREYEEDERGSDEEHPYREPAE